MHIWKLHVDICALKINKLCFIHVYVDVRVPCAYLGITTALHPPYHVMAGKIRDSTLVEKKNGILSNFPNASQITGNNTQM